MATVEIDGNSYEVYADVASADEYLAAAAHAEAWRAESDDNVKARALVTATRLIDRQHWVKDFDSFAKRTAEEAFVSASIELANAIIDGSEVQDRATTANDLRRMRAGSVEMEFFRGAEGPATRFPRIVHELIGKHLKGSGFTLGPVSAGTDRQSVFPVDYGFSGGI